MKLIFVASSKAAPAIVDLGRVSVRWKIAGIIAAGVVFFMGAGFVVAKVFADSRDGALRDVARMRQSIAQQKQVLANLETTTRRDMDALALQIGNLQAQATRLNALGQRLVDAGKFGDGEFDFTKLPAMGGSEDLDAQPHALATDLAGDVDGLRRAFADQETQLTVLEELLRDRSLQNAALPRGYPVANSFIGSGFGSRADPFSGESASHLGLDFDAEAGAAIHAVAGGVVVFAGERPGYGRVIEIDHGNGYMTRYAHNQENIAHVGDRIQSGQVVAKVGSTGRATGPHCHFEVWLNGKPLNPYEFVNGKIKPV